eukprot:5873079-Lingulodinium_polyedra.AAC.1
MPGLELEPLEPCDDGDDEDDNDDDDDGDDDGDDDDDADDDADARCRGQRLQGPLVEPATATDEVLMTCASMRVHARH